MLTWQSRELRCSKNHSPKIEAHRLLATSLFLFLSLSLSLALLILPSKPSNYYENATALSSGLRWGRFGRNLTRDMDVGVTTAKSILEKPLKLLTEEDISQLTREDCRKFLKEKGFFFFLSPFFSGLIVFDGRIFLTDFAEKNRT